MSETPAMSSGEKRGGYEARDVSFRPILGAAGGLVVVTLLVFLLVRWVFGYYAAREASSSPPANPLASTYGRQLPPAPRLQTAPIQDLRQLRASEDAVLNTYGWVDEKAGTVRVPIGRAMELLEQRGLPVRPEGGAQP
jgi:hypothetical protein